MSRRHLFDWKTATNACGEKGSGLGERSFLEEHPVNKCDACQRIALERIAKGELMVKPPFPGDAK